MKTKTRKKRITLEQLDEIAKEDGFPNFVKALEGPLPRTMYSNVDGNLVRVYNSRTGEKVFEYKPKQTSPRFSNPVEITSIVPNSVQTTGYSGKVHKKDIIW